MLTALSTLLTQVCRRIITPIKSLKFIFSFLLFIILNDAMSTAFAQDSVADVPYSNTARKPFSDFLTLYPESTMINSAKLAQAQSVDPVKSFQFAEYTAVNLTPENSGSWESMAKGRIWRLGIRSGKAFALYLNFDQFRLSNGVKLYVYSPGYRQLRGPYSSKGPGTRRLSTAPVSGDSLIVELNVPTGSQNYGQLRLSRVYHDIVGIFKKAALSIPDAPTGICDQNINCENGIYWQTEKHAICKIITDGAISTGTLIGNTAKNKRPYLLTSYHTMFDSTHAADAVFIFNYESSCNATDLHDLQTLSGATIAACTPGLDYTLLQLNNIPPPSFHPFYAGWDCRDKEPDQGVCIHHAGGKYTQIALDYRALSTATFGMGYLPNSSWKVSQWDIGFTAPGSSGAPLFNRQHRIVGTLTGGYSSCTYQGSDFFNKFSLAWEVSPELQACLDSLHTGFSAIDGYDPYGFDPGDCDTLTQISVYEQKVISTSGLQWGYLSGQNSSGFIAYAEKFISPSTLVIPGIFIDIAKLSYSSTMSNFQIKIWEGGDSPQKEIYRKTVFYKDLKPAMQNYIILDSAVRVHQTFFIGYEISYNTPGDMIAVYHAADRGKNGASSMYALNGTWKNTNTLDPFHYSTSLAISVTECYGRSRLLTREQLLLFPNPSRTYIDMIIPEGLVISNVRCYDVLGRLHPVTFRPSEVASRVFFDLPPGVYMLSVSSAGRQFSSKFIVQQ